MSLSLDRPQAATGPLVDNPLAILSLAIGLVTPVGVVLVAAFIAVVYPPATAFYGVGVWLVLGVLSGIPSIIMGHLALRRIRRSREGVGGRACALVGLIFGYISAAGSVLIITWFVLLLQAIADPDFPFQ